MCIVFPQRMPLREDLKKMRPSLPLQQDGCQAATIGAAAQSLSCDYMIAKYVLFENRYFYLLNKRVICSLFDRAVLSRFSSKDDFRGQRPLLLGLF